MIDFALSSEQESLQQSARDFLAKECPPLLIRDCVPLEDGVPRGLYREMGALGWMGVLVPEARGGLGLGALELAALCEELGRVAAPGPFLSTQLVIAALLKGGAPGLQRAWLPRLMAGEAFGALAYADDGAGHDPADVTLRATERPLTETTSASPALSEVGPSDEEWAWICRLAQLRLALTALRPIWGAIARSLDGVRLQKSHVASPSVSRPARSIPAAVPWAKPHPAKPVAV